MVHHIVLWDLKEELNGKEREEAAQAIVKMREVIEPEPELVALYETRYQKFREI